MEIGNTRQVGSPEEAGASAQAASPRGIKRSRSPDVASGGGDPAVKPPDTFKAARHGTASPRIRLLNTPEPPEPAAQVERSAGEPAADMAPRHRLLDALPAAMVDWDRALSNHGYMEASESPYEECDDFYLGACLLAEGCDEHKRFHRAEEAIGHFRSCASDASNDLSVRLAACHNLLVIAPPGGEVALHAAQQAFALLRRAGAAPQAPFTAGLLVGVYSVLMRQRNAITPDEQHRLPTLLDSVLQQLGKPATSEELTMLPLHYLAVFESTAAPPLRARIAQAAAPRLESMQTAVQETLSRNPPVSKEHVTLTMFAFTKLSAVHAHMLEGRADEGLRWNTGTFAAGSREDLPLADWLELESMPLTAGLACGSHEIATMPEVIASIPRLVCDCAWAHAQQAQAPHGSPYQAVLVPPPPSLDRQIARFGQASLQGQWAVRPLQYLGLLESAATPQAQAAIVERAAADFLHMSTAVTQLDHAAPVNSALRVSLLLAQFALAKLGTLHIMAAGLGPAAPISRETRMMIARLENLPQRWLTPDRRGAVPADEVRTMAVAVVHAKRLGRSLEQQGMRGPAQP